MFNLDWTNIKSALVYGVLSALLLMCLYAIQIGDIFNLNLKDLVNAGVFGFITVVVSLLKNLLTDNAGKFLGVTTVVPDKTEVV
jgi:hypothetical protein